jgi:hypothetical protein
MSARLRAVPPGEIPDDRAEVAAALLDRYAPLQPGLSDEMYAFLGWDAARLAEIERDPRYLIGRLAQSLAALLAQDAPPLNATERLLAEAIDEARRAREATAAACACGGDGCDSCLPDWVKAQQYFSLHGRLGLIGELPRAGLKAVPR